MSQEAHEEEDEHHIGTSQFHNQYIFTDDKIKQILNGNDTNDLSQIRTRSFNNNLKIHHRHCNVNASYSEKCTISSSPEVDQHGISSSDSLEFGRESSDSMFSSTDSELTLEAVIQKTKDVEL